jgi:putative DNA primase/helicase
MQQDAIDNIPEDLKRIPRWVVYRLRAKRGAGDKLDKIPYQCDGTPAKTNDASTWTDFERCRQCAEALGDGGGVGFVFDSDADDVVGVDLDDCIGEDGKLETWAVEACQTFRSYTELSPSGRGIHLFVRGNLPNCSRKRGKVEMYGKGRFFTVTGRRIGWATGVERNQAAIDWLAREYLDAAKVDPQQAKLKRQKPQRIHGDDREVARILSPLLSAARSDEYHEWIRVGLAMKAIGEDMFLEWDQFSQRSPKYDAEVVRKKWATMKPRRATTAWLVAMAREDSSVDRVAEALGAVVEPERAKRIAELPAEHVAEEDGELAIAAIELSEVVPGRVEWLWEPYIPRGMVSMLIGHPGVGKSTMLLDLAARIANGSRWPDGEPIGKPMRVGLGMIEDDIRRVTVPRLLAAGANLRNVLAMGGKQGKTGEYSVKLPNDAMKLEAFIRERRCELLILDPITAYMGERDSNAQQEVRDAIQPLAGIAERTGCAILLSNHTSKAWKERDAAFVGQGSIAFTAVARTQILLVREPQDGDKRVLWITKSNVGPDLSVGGLAFVPRITAGATVPTCCWDEEPYHDTLDEFLRKHRRGSEEGACKADQAIELISDYLRQEIRAPRSAVLEMVKQSGIGTSSAKKAVADGVDLGRWVLEDAGRNNAKVLVWHAASINESEVGQ